MSHNYAGRRHKQHGIKVFITKVKSQPNMENISSSMMAVEVKQVTCTTAQYTYAVQSLDLKRP
jgi:hypothetical protein